MRKLAVIIRNMLVHKQDYVECRDAMIERRKQQRIKLKAKSTKTDQALSSKPETLSKALTKSAQ